MDLGKNLQFESAERGSVRRVGFPVAKRVWKACRKMFLQGQEATKVQMEKGMFEH
jgi:hypothetical protein